MDSFWDSSALVHNSTIKVLSIYKYFNQWLTGQLGNCRALLLNVASALDFRKEIKWSQTKPFDLTRYAFHCDKIWGRQLPLLPPRFRRPCKYFNRYMNALQQLRMTRIYFFHQSTRVFCGHHRRLTSKLALKKLYRLKIQVLLVGTKLFWKVWPNNVTFLK